MDDYRVNQAFGTRSVSHAAILLVAGTTISACRDRGYGSVVGVGFLGHRAVDDGN